MLLTVLEVLKVDRWHLKNIRALRCTGCDALFDVDGMRLLGILNDGYLIAWHRFLLRLGRLLPSWCEVLTSAPSGGGVFI